jgi:hypothetical protein
MKMIAKKKKITTKKSSILSVGNKVFIRTVTNYLTGKIVKIDKNFIELSTAAWIADTGRFSIALKTGVFSEVEPFPNNVCVSIFSIVDCCEWKFDLPIEIN